MRLYQQIPKKYFTNSIPIHDKNSQQSRNTEELLRLDKEYLLKSL